VVKEASAEDSHGVHQSHVIRLVVLLRVFNVLVMDGTVPYFGFAGLHPNRPNSPEARVAS